MNVDCQKFGGDGWIAQCDGVLGTMEGEKGETQADMGARIRTNQNCWLLDLLWPLE